MNLSSTVPGIVAPSFGMIYVHSCPSYLLRQVEWSIGNVLGEQISMPWLTQPLARNSYRAEVFWQHELDVADDIASVLIGWLNLRFEVTQEAAEPRRYLYTPTLGLFHSPCDSLGNFLVGENRIREAIATASLDTLQLHQNLNRLLGTPWDVELEPFRAAGMNTPQVWLHKVV